MYRKTTNRSVTHCAILSDVRDLVDGLRVRRLGVVLRVHVPSHGRAADDVEGAVGDARSDVGCLLSLHVFNFVPLCLIRQLHYLASVGVRSQDVVGQNFHLLVHHVQKLLQNLQFEIS